MSTVIMIAGVVIFAIRVVAGIVFIVSVGIQREERVFHNTGRVSMTRLAPDRVSQGTRSLVGLTVCQRADLDPPLPKAFAVRRI
jgi:hypothetical protein